MKEVIDEKWKKIAEEAELALIVCNDVANALSVGGEGVKCVLDGERVNRVNVEFEWHNNVSHASVDFEYHEVKEKVLNITLLISEETRNWGRDFLINSAKQCILEIWSREFLDTKYNMRIHILNVADINDFDMDEFYDMLMINNEMPQMKALKESVLTFFDEGFSDMECEDDAKFVKMLSEKISKDSTVDEIRAICEESEVYQKEVNCFKVMMEAFDGLTKEDLERDVLSYLNRGKLNMELDDLADLVEDRLFSCEYELNSSIFMALTKKGDF